MEQYGCAVILETKIDNDKLHTFRRYKKDELTCTKWAICQSVFLYIFHFLVKLFNARWIILSYRIVSSPFSTANTLYHRLATTRLVSSAWYQHWLITS